MENKDIVMYEDFCKEIQCVHYNTIKSIEEKLKNQEVTFELLTQLTTERFHCDYQCEHIHSPKEFYQWITRTNN